MGTYECVACGETVRILDQASHNDAHDWSE